MFGIGFDELIIIVIIAILFLGPDKLPEAAVKFTRFLKSAKKVMNDAKSAIESEMKIAELKEEAMGYKKKLDEATNDLNSFKNIAINPSSEITKAVDSAKESLSGSAKSQEEESAPKKEVITFKKRDKKPESKE